MHSFVYFILCLSLVCLLKFKTGRFREYRKARPSLCFTAPWVFDTFVTKYFLFPGFLKESSRLPASRWAVWGVAENRNDGGHGLQNGTCQDVSTRSFWVNIISQGLKWYYSKKICHFFPLSMIGFTLFRNERLFGLHPCTLCMSRRTWCALESLESSTWSLSCSVFRY